eukprot:TRINITY_DN33581_c0_g1_i1.p1 TRINITY_DN33581_c0_g1~~TRINITY_DN33581_c0_g1_i1.p1  ORF type:complete len:353 (+),score=80.43 TRINITY_DN33581_c0_g1_i1:44-1102(+)
MLSVTSRKIKTGQASAGKQAQAFSSKSQSVSLQSIFGKARAASAVTNNASLRSGRTSGRSGDEKQKQLAVARQCRDCGQRLSAVEDSLHFCTAALEWPFPADAVAGAWTGARLSGSPSSGSNTGGRCRIVALGASALRKGTTACARLEELWRFVQEGDLSHSLDLPSAEAVATKTAWLLLALRGREVVGLVSTERLLSDQIKEHRICNAPGLADLESTAAEAEETFPPAAATPPGSTTRPLDAEETPPPLPISDIDRPAKRQRTNDAKMLLGIALVWVRRSERRRGLATSLVDAARLLAEEGCSFGSVPSKFSVSVAFSQPTNLGIAFARQYEASRSRDEVLLYEPKWSQDV